MSGEGRAHVIYAKDASPAAIADAFKRAALTREGLLGPIGQLTVIIPGGLTEAEYRESLRATSSVPPLAALNRLRSHPFCIGGYAAVFHGSWRSGGREVLEPGCLAAALARGGWSLLRDHAGTPLASMDSQTLQVETDAHGLWFEASLPDTLEGATLAGRIRRGEISTVSIGSSASSGVQTDGRPVWTKIMATEISLVMPPNTAARSGTWVRLLGVATRERQRLGGGAPA